MNRTASETQFSRRHGARWVLCAFLAIAVVHPHVMPSRDALDAAHAPHSADLMAGFQDVPALLANTQTQRNAGLFQASGLHVRTAWPSLSGRQEAACPSNAVYPYCPPPKTSRFILRHLLI